MNNNLDTDEEKSSFYKGFYNEGLYVVNEPDMPIGKLADKPAAEMAGPEHKLLSLSGNKMANTLLLFNYPQTSGVPDSDKVFVSQVLSAINLNFENIAWLNIAQVKDFNLELLKNHATIQQVVAFGIDESLYPEKTEEGQIHITNHQKILKAGKLADISMNKSQKKLLWDGLKQLFGL